jgi:hypothetical protein
MGEFFGWERSSFLEEQIAFALRQAERRACRVLGFARSSFRYKSRRNQRADRHPLAEQIRAAIEGCSATDVRERAQHVSG